jgi:hypothetical protein
MADSNQGVSLGAWQFCSYQTQTVVVTADPRNQDPPGGLTVMNHQTVEFSVWLGMAVVALICAGLSLWRVRRLLNRHRQGVHVSHGQLIASALVDQTSLVRAP